MGGRAGRMRAISSSSHPRDVRYLFTSAAFVLWGLVSLVFPQSVRTMRLLYPNYTEDAWVPTLYHGAMCLAVGGLLYVTASHPSPQSARVMMLTGTLMWIPMGRQLTSEAGMSLSLLLLAGGTVLCMIGFAGEAFGPTTHPPRQRRASMEHYEKT